MLFERDVYQTIVTALFCALKVNGLQKVHKIVDKAFISSWVSQMDNFMVQFCHLITFIV